MQREKNLGKGSISNEDTTVKPKILERHQNNQRLRNSDINGKQFSGGLIGNIRSKIRK